MHLVLLLRNDDTVYISSLWAQCIKIGSLINRFFVEQTASRCSHVNINRLVGILTNLPFHKLETGEYSTFLQNMRFNKHIFFIEAYDSHVKLIKITIADLPLTVRFLKTNLHDWQLYLNSLQITVNFLKYVIDLSESF